METCYRCSGTGMTLSDNGDPGNCPVCKGDTVIPDDGKVEIEIDLDDETFNIINSAALIQGITFDEYVEKILERAVEENKQRG